MVLLLEKVTIPKEILHPLPGFIDELVDTVAKRANISSCLDEPPPSPIVCL